MNDQEVLIIEQANVLDGEYGIQKAKRPFVNRNDPKNNKTSFMFSDENELLFNPGNALRVYDSLKVNCLKENSDNEISLRQKAVIDDLTFFNQTAIDRAEAAETELKTLRKFLSLWGG